MLQSLARNHKTIAWFLVTLFYLQLVAPVVARANSLAYEPFHSSYGAGNWNRSNVSRKPFTNDANKKVSAVSATDKTAKKVNHPAHVKGVATTGPTQPEMQSFQSVNSNNLVDPFTGDFSYNIPLLDVGGYPVNLHYQSGVTMDQEASWVGLGWNINPGVVSRNMRGLPDDFKGDDQIEKTVSIKPNRTIGGVIGQGVEIFGGPVNIGSDLSVSVFHNTYKGWGLQTARNLSVGIGVGAHGSLSGGLSITNNTQNGTDISPSMGFQMGVKENTLQGSINIGTNYNTRTGIQNLQITGQMRAQVNATQNLRVADPGLGRFSTSISFSKPSYTPTIPIPYNSRGWTFKLKGGVETEGFFNHKDISGYMSTQEIKDPVKLLPAYGYMYYEKANNNPNALLDYNREKDVAWTDNSPNIAVPIYTYDTWSISGEGTGGMFRPYRSDIGYVYDPKLVTTSDNTNIGADIGFGEVLKAGIDYQGIDAYTKNNAWLGDNQLAGVLPFKSANDTYENVYFKNPGEKTAVDKLYQQALGGDNLMRVDLSATSKNKVVTATRQLSLFQNGRATSKISFDANTLRTQRDKRGQVISYLNAREAAEVGLDKKIKSYPINSFPSSSCSNGVTEIDRYDNSFRRKHHLSEISVLNDDGRRYIYGIPVYNIKQVDITMATDPGDNSTGLVDYNPATDKNTGNTQGKDGYFNKEVIPAYSHSFLLSGILSSDYVDLTGDGITEDDMGDAVKFNYSEVYSLTNPYTWRAPFQQNKASYNEGLKTDSRDEKGSFTYGEREVWYLNSVESKTMIATFVLDADRKDGYGVAGEDGGQGTKKLYKLKEINLYTKADFKKNGTNAQPIKTVHFEYSYELCPKNPGSLTDSGKLTLKKVWFSYNGNFKGKRNPYVFTYGGSNPEFSLKSVDRWGNYKYAPSNPGNPVLSNADYPYTLQPNTNAWTESQANNGAAPWALNEIKLPSGGRLKVTYESDDYAYVQNKRAMQFFSIKGFGESPTAQPKSNLYRSSGDYQYVFINVSQPVADKADVTRTYLDGVTQLYLKMAVDMPGDNWGRGYELVPCYADIEDYGVTANDRQVIWIKVKQISSGKSPMAMAAIQFLRLNLPSKAYPFSEPGDNIDIRTAVNMLINVSTFVVNLLKESGFDNKIRNSNKCNSVELDKSFARLDNPTYRKFGGGLRVKKTEVFDNWNNMTAKTGKQQDSAVYGQTYTYTDTVLINGVKTGISSGVASYEPMIGGDENPFHVPAKVYSEKVGAMAPTNYMYVEEPFAETFFPGASVGYSKIRVQTIHRKNKSASGFDETEFYTTKDFPTLVEYTPIDDDSKKPYKTPISNPFFFDARNYVTLSQGFKVELNDMNGKPKAQSAYAQNDPDNPISYTYNYYRLVNDNAGQPKLSNTVPIASSADGKIDMAGEIGKEVEVMVDLREQTSVTKSTNIEANLDLIGFGPFLFPVITVVPGVNGETNRYRAVSVLKIVNRYGILDSVIHIEKGSKVTTRNLVYDGETGDVLLSQTNNEFDDPLYNFNYPAYWAYTGMEPAYRNIGTILNDVHFKKGILFSSANTRVPVDNYFESGDELLVLGYDKRNGSNDDCAADYFQFDKTQDPTYKKIWAIDASRGKQKQNGIYFIDKWGVPYSCDAVNIRIIRSGKRNLAGTAVGSITSLQTPVRVDNGIPRFVFDTATHVITASAARFKDMWAVDSTIFRKDTTIIATHRMVPIPLTIPADDYYSLQNYKGEGNNDDHNVIPAVDDINMFEASAYDNGTGSWDREVRSFLRFNMYGIPQGALINSATLHLYGNQDAPDVNDRASNKSWIEHLNSGWVKDVITNAANDADRRYAYYYYWDNPEPVDPDPATKVLIPETPHGQDVVRNETIDITPMARNMLHDLYADGNWPVIRIRLDQAGGGKNLLSRLTYNSNLNCQTQTQTFAKTLAAIPNSCMPTIELDYFPPCADGSQPYYLAQPPFGSDDPTLGGGYYCNLSRVDTFVCRPNINDTAVNPYRLGLLGNWRMDRAYTYYGNRMQTDPAAATGIRTDGVIKDFATYWTFNDNTLMGASTDTSRWVWNSELARFNYKGSEIENHDPLDRYNSGQYGYNQTLPVAVAQHAKNREIAFDGFEDYGYRTDDCIKCVLNRHIDLGKDANLVDTVSHTGLYSRRVNGNEVGYATFNIGTPGEVKDAPELSMKEDSVPLVNTTIHGDGDGLTKTFVTFFNRDNHPDWPWESLGDGPIDYTSPQPELHGIVDMEFTWRGYIQPRYTGLYTFYARADNVMTAAITVDGTWILLTENSPVQVFGHAYNQFFQTKSVWLQAGELYYLDVWGAQNNDNFFQFQLEWESANQVRENISKYQLYPEGIDIAAAKNRTITKDTTWCVKFSNPTGTNLTHKRFSPIQGQKVMVSAWVKQDQPCVSGNYDNAAISLAFNNSTGTNYFNFTPTGNIIEGWQRIEDTLTIPQGATSMTLNMKATSGTPVFFDDIRVQPFNANMKSFVYNPVNLRLMAELDENNYATFYEYDDEGTLIRVKKETEKGIKTIKETRSALLKE